MIVEITEGMQLDRYKVHDIEAVIDRIIIQGGEKENRVREGIDQALKMGDGLVIFHLLSERKRLNLFTALHVYGYGYILCHTITEHLLF